MEIREAVVREIKLRLHVREACQMPLCGHRTRNRQVVVVVV
jgi:hypothetical protein